jgi:RNA 2',3'-cyclic 3'-phosphodiesterase
MTHSPDLGSISPDEKPRLFVAIELPDEWKSALGTLQQEMQAKIASEPDLARVRVRWVKPEGIHLTLKFLGETPVARLDSVVAALDSAVPEAPGIELSLSRVGAFSDRRAPRVIWAGIFEKEGGARSKADHGRLLQLAERIETWLAAAGFPRERRSFAPHLTLARLPEDLDQSLRERVASVTNAFPTPTVPPLKVDSVSLIRSRLGAGGARYERLGSWPA